MIKNQTQTDLSDILSEGIGLIYYANAEKKGAVIWLHCL